MADRTPKPDSPAAGLLVRILGQPLLWPVAAVGLLAAVAAGALILALAVGARDFLSGIALLILLFLTVWGLEADIRTRRLSTRNRVVVALWLASAIGAFALEQLGALP